MELSLWVTNKCNMHCKYCYVTEKKGCAFFKEEDIGNLLKFISTHIEEKETIYFNFFGGEPLLAYDIIKKIVEAMLIFYDNNVQYSLTTNGLLLNNEMISFFINNHFLISLSWDGCEKAHDYNRIDVWNNGTYWRVREKYLLLKSSGLDSMRVRATFNSKTYISLKESIKDMLIVDSDIHAVFVPDYFDKNWNIYKLNELTNIISEIKHDFKLNNITLIGDTNKKEKCCNGGINNYHINVDGRIYPCSFIVNVDSFCIGNITNGLIQSKIDMFAKEYQSALDTCIGCDYEKYCLSYKCRFLNYSLTGHFNQAPKIICNMENIKLSSN